MQKEFLNLIFVFFLGTSLATPCFALSALDIPSQSNRSLGAAGAYTAIVDGASAFNLNPAGLSRNAQYRRLYIDSRFYKDFRHWGLKTALIDGVTEDPVHWGFLFDTTHTRELKKEQYVVSASSGFKDIIFFGTSTRFTHFRESPAATSQWMFSIDTGLLAFVSDHISLGASLKNLLRPENSANLIPFSYAGGLGLNFKYFRLDLDAERNHSGHQLTFRAGGEWMVSPYVVLRAGYFQDRTRTEYGYSIGGSYQMDPRFGLDIGFLDQLHSSYKIFSAGLSFTL
jgi:hypothetical protein